MTGQPAINYRILAAMAIDTSLHAPGFPGQALQIGHLSVTFLAGNFGVNVALMIEKHMFGHNINLHPGCGGLSVEILMLLLNLRVL